MDESKNQKNTFIEKTNLFFHSHQKTIILLAVIFFLVFVVVLVLIIYFQKRNANLQIEENNITINETQNLSINQNNNLFPVFNEVEKKESLEEEVQNLFDENEIDANTSRTENLTALELRPVLAFTVVNQKSSIKEFIQNKPTVCNEKIEKAVANESSLNVTNLQKTLQSFPGIKNQEITGKLDEATRNNLYIIQKRYGNIIYQNSKSKNPTRVVDVETAHFINILCGYEKEGDKEFVYIPVVRYVLKQTGEVIEFNTKTKEKGKYKQLEEIKPEEVIFSPDGNFAVYRWEDEKGMIKSKILNIKNSTFIDLEDNIKTISFSPVNKVAYGVKNGDNLNIYTYDMFAQKVASLTSLPLTEWYIDWLDDNSLRITSKPSGITEGISMTLDIKNKKFLQDISPMLGLNTKNLSTKRFTLVQKGGLGNSQLLLLNNETKNLSALGIDGFTEKCSKNILQNGIFCAVPLIINKVVLYPDDWYKEKIHTKDKIVYINFEGGSKIDVAQLTEKDISVKDLSVSTAGIFLLDSKTLALYILTVK
jgi:hypothetical protein